MKFDKDTLEKIYDILVKYAGARTNVVTIDDETFCWEKLDFVQSHIDKETREYRFCGDLGFGGKYRVNTNTVTCYPEDMTPEREAFIRITNDELKKLEYSI